MTAAPSGPPRAASLAGPVPPPPQWQGLKPSNYEYRHVRVQGTFDNDKETLVFRPSEDGPGYLVMTPLALASGGTIIVNRGWVPDSLKAHTSRTAGGARRCDTSITTGWSAPCPGTGLRRVCAATS